MILGTHLHKYLIKRTTRNFDSVRPLVSRKAFPAYGILYGCLCVPASHTHSIFYKIYLRNVDIKQEYYTTQ
jgi:hypothetical protein